MTLSRGTIAFQNTRRTVAAFAPRAFCPLEKKLSGAREPSGVRPRQIYRIRLCKRNSCNWRRDSLCRRFILATAHRFARAFPIRERSKFTVHACGPAGRMSKIPRGSAPDDGMSRESITGFETTGKI